MIDQLNQKIAKLNQTAEIKMQEMMDTLSDSFEKVEETTKFRCLKMMRKVSR